MRYELERAKGFEPSTSTLARLRSTPELRPLIVNLFSFLLGQSEKTISQVTYRSPKKLNKVKWIIYFCIFKAIHSFGPKWIPRPLLSVISNYSLFVIFLNSSLLCAPQYYRTHIVCMLETPIFKKYRSNSYSNFFNFL